MKKSEEFKENENTQNPIYLGFMYNKGFAISKTTVKRWLEFPAFSQKIEEFVRQNRTIDNEAVYEAIKEAYFPVQRDSDLYGFTCSDDMSQKLTRKGLRALSETLYGKQEMWETDYKNFLENDHEYKQKMEGFQKGRSFGFLYRKCKKIRPYVITRITAYPELIEEIKSYVGDITDETVLNSMINLLLKQDFNEDTYKNVKGLINRVYRDINGNGAGWKPRFKFSEKELDFIRNHDKRLILRKMRIIGFPLSYWLTIPEFVDKVEQMDTTIEKVEQEICKIMQEICSEKRQSGGVFDFNSAYKAIKLIAGE